MKLPDHGTRARYKRGCRCYACTEANSVYYARRRHTPGVRTPDKGKVLQFPLASAPEPTATPPLTPVVAARTEVQKDAFLSFYAQSGNLTAAAKHVGISTAEHRRWIHDDPDYENRFASAHESYCDWIRGRYHDALTAASTQDLINHPVLLIHRAKSLMPEFRENPNVVNVTNVSISAEEVGQLVRQYSQSPQVQELVRSRIAAQLGNSDDA